MADMNFRLDETPPGMRPQPSSVGRVAAAEKSTPSRRGKAPHLPVRQPGGLTVVSPEALRTALAGGVPLSRDENLARSFFFESYRSGFQSVKIEHVYAILWSDAKKRIAPSGVGYPLPDAGEYQELAIQPPVDAVGLQHSLDVGARLGKRDALDEEIRIGPALPGEPPCGGGAGGESGKGEDAIPAEALEHPAEISGPVA